MGYTTILRPLPLAKERKSPTTNPYERRADKWIRTEGEEDKDAFTQNTEPPFFGTEK